jgi:hypothetical protein
MRNGSTRGVVVGLTALLGVGCAEDSAPGGPCDPLMGREIPVALASVVAAGKHADATIYVIDKPADGEHRVFVSDDRGLVRKRVAGSGTTPTSVVVNVTEAEPAFLLKAELEGGRVSRMGVLRGMTMERDFPIGEQGDLLQLVAPDAVKDMTARSLTAVHVEYVAGLADGRRLVVIRPRDDWRPEDVRLFLGLPAEVKERKVDSFVRRRDGGTTDIVFEIDGQGATAHFPSPTVMDTPWLQERGERLALEVAVPGMPPAGLTFICR